MRTPHEPSNHNVTRLRVRANQSYQTIWLVAIVALFAGVFGMLPGAPIAHARSPLTSERTPLPPVAQNVPKSQPAQPPVVVPLPVAPIIPGNSALPTLARPLAAPVASVSLNVPSQVMIGQDLSFTAIFANPSPDTGYGPIIDLILPTNGADGNGNTSLPLDGITFLNATYLGAPVIATAQVFPGSGITPTMVTEPYTYAANGQPLPVYGTPGDTLVSLQLPFGSFTPGQPPASIVVTVHLSNFADAGTALTIQARGGYEYGATALNDWCCGDPSIVNPTWTNASTTPTVLTASKSNNAPEGETATGPNFPRGYSLSATIPPGQTVTNFHSVDPLPNNVQYQNSLTSAPAFITATQPITTAPQNSPASTLDVSIPSVTNTATSSFTFFIPISDANGSAIVNPTTGACATSLNPLDVSALWTPLDPRDTPTVVTATLAPGNTLSDCALVVQKSVTDLTHPGAPTPLDTVQYTLSFQISDYFAFQNISLQDFLPDGIHFDPTFTPTLAVTAHGTPSSGTMRAANYPVTDHWTGAPSPVAPVDGTTEINFRVSDELAARGLSPQVLGGCVPNGGGDPDCSTFNGGASIGTIVFRAKIQNSYTDIYPSSRNVYLGDTLNNTVTITGAVLDNRLLTPTGNIASNPSSASVTIVSPVLTKSVYGVNGTICDPCASPRVMPGDSVTYHIKYQLPSADYSNQTFVDYLPLPIYDATTIVGPFDTTITSTAPTAGHAHFGPAETLFGVTGVAPTITTSAPNNSVTFAYGSFADSQSRNLTTDILFSVVVKNDPFADSLFLTNQVEARQDNHAAQIADAIVQVQLGEPLLTTSKSVIASTNPNTIYSLLPVGPVTFTVPGSPGARWVNPINSTNLAANPIHSNANGVDAYDVLSFALVIQNSGTSAKGAFDLIISDTIPTGFVTPPSGLNLRVSYGDGSGPINYTKPGGSVAVPSDLFGLGIKLADPSPTQGVCQVHSLTNGLNIVIVTYDLQVASNIPSNQSLTNIGALVHYAGDSGGPNFLPTPQIMPATVATAPPIISKAIFGTNQPSTTGTNVAIGEIITYAATITVPEGVTSNVILTDTLADGLAFVTSTVASSLSSGLSLSGSTTPTITNAGKIAIFNLGNLTNSNNNALISATLTLTYPVVVLNVPQNARTDTRTNSVQMSYITFTLPTVATPAATIVEPNLLVAKTATPATGDAGDVITFTLTISNAAPGNTTVFDVVLTDTVPSYLTYEPGSFAFVSGVAPTALITNTPLLTATWDSLAVNISSTLRFRATLNNNVAPNQIITNTGYLTGTGLPGDYSTPQSPYNTASVERTGNASDIGGSASAKYRANGDASVTNGNLALGKAILSTSLADTSGSNVTIGELITYSITITLPEGITPPFDITDTLPSGVSYVYGFERLDLTGFNGTASSTGFMAIGNDLLIHFSNPITVTADNDPTNNRFSVRFAARVRDFVGNTGSPATSLPNSAVAEMGGSVASSNVVTATVVEPQLNIAKTITPNTDAPNDVVTFTLTITNTGTSTAYDVSLSDPLSNAQFTNITAVTTPGGFTFSAMPSGGNTIVQYTGGTLITSGSATFSFTATLASGVTRGTIITNTATVTGTTLPGTDSNERVSSVNGSATLTATAPDISVSKSDGRTTIVPGATTVYTITVTNIGTRDATGVVLTDTLPANTNFVSANGTYTNTSGTLTFAPFNLATSASVTRLVTVTVSNPLPAGTTAITNTARAVDDGTHGADTTPSNNLASDSDSTTAAPVLNLVKTDGGATTTPGGTVIYTIMYSNTGNIGAAGVTITDTVPANTTFNPIASAPGWSCAPNNNAGGLCTLTIGTVPVGSGASVLFAVSVGSTLSAGANPITNTAYISDDSGIRNSGADTTQISGIAPDLTITKTDGGVTATANSLITYTLRYTNTGNIGASNVLISETVPAYTTFAGPLATWSCNIGDGAGTWCMRNVGVVASGGSGTIQYSVRITNSVPVSVTAIANTVRVSDDGANGQDPNPNNNGYTRTTPFVAGTAALTITKSANVSVASAGSVITYTLRYTNTGTADATGVVLTDTVPVSTTFTGTGWTYAPNINAGSTCTRTVGTVAVGGSSSAQFVVTVANPLPPSVTQIVNTATIGDDASHAATATSTLPTSPPPSSLRFYLPFIARAPAPPIPPTRTPTATPSPTPYRWPVVDPKGMVSDPTRDRLWLASHYDDSVVVFTESTITATIPTLLRKITVGQKPFGIGLVDNKVYVANTGVPQPASMSVIDAATMTVIKTISLSSCGGEATHLAVNPTTHRVYTTLHASARVAVIDTTSDTLVACVTVESGPFGIAAHPASNSIFVGSRDGLKLQRIDGATNIATQVKNWSNGSGGGSPFYVGINPTTNLLFAMVGLPSSDRPNKLYVYSIDGSGNLSNERIAEVGNTDDGGFIVQSQCSGMIYVAETADNQVRILTSDLSSYGVVTEASGLVGHGPFGLLENPTLKRVYVSNKPANTLSVLSECPGPLAPRAMQAMTPLPTATLTPGSRTPTLTNTPTVTATLAATPVPTIAPTVTATPTKTPPPKPAPTITPSPTNTPARTATPTSTATLAAPPTLRATSTLTATSSITTTK